MEFLTTLHFPPVFCGGGRGGGLSDVRLPYHGVAKVFRCILRYEEQLPSLSDHHHEAVHCLQHSTELSERITKPPTSHISDRNKYRMIGMEVVIVDNNVYIIVVVVHVIAVAVLAVRTFSHI